MLSPSISALDNLKTVPQDYQDLKDEYQILYTKTRSIKSELKLNFINFVVSGYFLIHCVYNIQHNLRVLFITIDFFFP